MGYNNRNKYLKYKKIQEITMEKYEKGFNTLIGVYNRYIFPEFFISYSCYRRILEEGNLSERIREEEKKTEGKQIELFNEEEYQ